MMSYKSDFTCNFCGKPARMTDILEQKKLLVKIKIKCNGCGVEWSEWVCR